MQCKDINLDLIRKEFEKIIDGIENKINKKDALHTVESMIFKELLSLGQLLFQYFLNSIFSQSRLKNKEYRKSGLKNCGLTKRTLITIFGMVEILRLVWSCHRFVLIFAEIRTLLLFPYHS